jgi:hypothetical protein
MAKTILNNNFDEDDFVNRMCINDPSLDKDQVNKFLRVLKSTTADILSEGNSISLSEFVRFSPVVKGTFDGISDGYDASRNYVGLSCTVLQSFVNDFQKLVSVEKTDKPSNMPQILFIENNKSKSNILMLKYANKIFGINFDMGGYKLKGIKIIDSSKTENVALIEEGSIEILKHKGKELFFNFRDYAPSDWLTENLSIFVQLRFESVEGKTSMESDMFESVWSSAK